ncbi:MAG: hypothetical protein HYR72_13640 [Deltaproteobacteria bacterium]|nr:hypothetical protein [Deltaproteobacteria bacterium]MBI3391182.1 hypothetical protein [Deltaproteobacteria bacterium]
MSVTFYPMWFRDPVEAQVWVTVQWGPFGEPMKFLTEPIQPPPGYEDVSMDPPTLVPLPTRTSGPAQSPTEGPEGGREPLPLATSPQPLATAHLRAALPTQQPTRAPVSDEAPATRAWKWLVIIGVGLIAAAALGLRWWQRLE